MFLFQLNFGRISQQTDLTESQQNATRTVERAYNDKAITKTERDATIKEIKSSKTSEDVRRALDNLAKMNENFRSYYEDFLTLLKQQMTEKTKEPLSPFMQNPDPNLVYAQGAGIAKQLNDEKEKAGDQGAAFWTTKESKGRKKAA